MAILTTSVTRQPKLLLGAIFAVLLLFLLYAQRERANTPPVFKTTLPAGLGGPNTDTGIYDGKSNTAVNEYAHRFKSPDDFRDHFRVVRQLSSVSVLETKRTCNWNPHDLEGMQFTWGLETDWVVNKVPREETEEKRREWQAYYENNLIPWSKAKSHFKGRGIICSAGNAGTLKRLAILLRQLNNLGSKLPVEVHYWAEEMNDKDKAFLSNIYSKISFNDLSGPDQLWKTGPMPLNYGHFNLKTAAVVNSKFEEFLLIDSDNLPVQLPETLFETDTYKEYGTIFWPDISRTRPENPMWAITRTFCKTDEYEQESGQLVVDKRRFFYHLQLAAWFNEQTYYRSLVLGDKDMFRFAWHALKTRYGRPGRWLTNAGFKHGDKYCGHTFAQRHPNGQVAFLHRGLFKLHTKASIKYFKERGGFYTYFKQSQHDTDLTFPEKSAFTFDTVEGANLQVWHCMDMPNVTEVNINELIPGIEKTFERLGGYWQLDEPDNDVTGLLDEAKKEEAKEAKKEEAKEEAKEEVLLEVEDEEYVDEVVYED